MTKSRGRIGRRRSFEVFDLLGSRFGLIGKGLQETEKDIQERYGTLVARRVHLQRKECVSLRAKCATMVSDAFSTAVNSNPEIDFQTKNESRRRSGRPQEEDVVGDEAACTKMILPTMAETCLEGVMAWAFYDSDFPFIKTLRSILRWRTTAWWKGRCAWTMHVDPTNVSQGNKRKVSTTEAWYGTVVWRSGLERARYQR